ncbi:MAG: DUF5309 family protein [Phycisphaeraceae bacterium]|nr:DUF5309 family protein [Phycisphaeraceae bacterium]
MSFTGKATYSAGTALPEIAEDVSDIIGIVSPYETPLLDHLGDPRREATSTIHEWIEDTLLPNTDVIDDATFSDPDVDTEFDVAHGSRFRVGDQIQVEGSREVMLVTNVSSNTLTVVRGYGSTTAENLADEQVIRILGNAALEGDDAPAARFTSRSRRSNYTQIFTSTVEVSGSQLAARQLAVADELDYQKQERLRELVRDLENCVINGVSPASNPQGDASTRRTLRGIIPSLSTNVSDASAAELDEDLLNTALRSIWERSNARIDTIVVSGFQKRQINSFMTSLRSYDARNTRFRDLVSAYESDFGVCRVVLSRWVPADAVLLLDSSRIEVLPLAGRSFHYKALAETGDRSSGQVIGEYTLELRNENAHGLIHNLATSAA